MARRAFVAAESKEILGSVSGVVFAVVAFAAVGGLVAADDGSAPGICGQTASRATNSKVRQFMWISWRERRGCPMKKCSGLGDSPGRHPVATRDGTVVSGWCVRRIGVQQ